MASRTAPTAIAMNFLFTKQALANVLGAPIVLPQPMNWANKLDGQERTTGPQSGTVRQTFSRSCRYSRRLFVLKREGPLLSGMEPTMQQEKPMKIIVETVVHAPIEKVWRAYTTPEDIKAWNAASDDWHTTAATVDLRA